MIIGIDLGTTNSLAAFINREGRPEIIINERGSRLTPSVVYFKNDKEVMVGELARSQAVLKQDRTVSLIKRRMGTDYQVDIAGREYTPSEISALVLRKVTQYAAAYLGEEVDKAVITVPAYFNDNQRQATLKAGELAGIDVVKLLNEPTAAALAYGFSRQEDENILVLDIGGGTFDITLMEYREGVCMVAGTGGSTSLGGTDFDNLLTREIIDNFAETNRVDLSLDPVALQQVYLGAEKAKVDLSTVNECQVLIPYITMGERGPLHLSQSLNRPEFNALSAGLWLQIRSLIAQTLEQAGVSREWVEVMVMAGGASRMPGFRELAAELFPGVPVRAEINPDEVVALGAAVEAGRNSGVLKSIDFKDATSHTLGVEDDGGDFVPLIPGNTPYPVRKTRLFTTVRNNQEEVIIHVMQKDDLSGDAACISLGRFHLEGIKQGKAGEANIDVTFEIDDNGVVRVSAVDLDTGQTNQIQVSEVQYLAPGHNLGRRGTGLMVV